MQTDTTLPGTPLTREEFESGVLTTHWVPNAQYAWDAGIAIGRYLEGLQDGEIIGSRCRRCARTVVPPRVFCENCFGPMDEFVKLKDTGTINTFSLCYVTWDVQLVDHPQIPAVIEIDGADPLHGILHVLGDVEPADVQFGMRVQAVWKPAEERIGSITDIEYFRPL
jgi:uncharacterized OB-fold protein